MKAKLIFLFFFLAGCAHSSSTRAPSSSGCKIGGDSCPLHQLCMNVEKDQSSCKPSPEEAPFTDLLLPFDTNTEVICTHSSGVGSHSWPNAFFALDLANPYDQKPAIVRAAKAGKAFIFGAEGGGLCPTPKGTPDKLEPSSCGKGWGNHIKILHENGYYTFYVHLEKFLVKNGEFVKRGQPIGIEGGTGLAGHRHLHWSVQKLPGNSPEEWQEKLDWDDQSVPFSFQAILNGKMQTVNSSSLNCPHANIGEATNQPHLRGIY